MCYGSQLPGAGAAERGAPARRAPEGEGSDPLDVDAWALPPPQPRALGTVLVVDDVAVNRVVLAAQASGGGASGASVHRAQSRGEGTRSPPFCGRPAVAAQRGSRAPAPRAH
jgi:hypothetical protein